jgi:hypothetical protein
MPRAMQIRQTGGPEVLIWTAVDAGKAGSVVVPLRQAAAGLNDAAHAHKTLEARATSGSAILTI